MERAKAAGVMLHSGRSPSKDVDKRRCWPSRVLLDLPRVDGRPEWVELYVDTGDAGKNKAAFDRIRNHQKEIDRGLRGRPRVGAPG